MALRRRNIVHEQLPAQVLGSTEDEDGIFGSVESDEIYIDPTFPEVLSDLTPVRALYPDIRRRNPQVASPHKTATPATIWLSIFGFLMLALVLILMVVVAILYPAVERERDLLSNNNTPCFDVTSIEYDAANPQAYVDGILENFPEIVPFSYTLRSTALPKILFELDVLQNWIQQEQTNTKVSHTKSIHAIHHLRRTRDDLSRIMKLHAQTFDLKTLQNAEHDIDFFEFKRKGWPNVSEITTELLEAMKVYIRNFYHGIGDGSTQSEVKQLLYQRPVEKKGFDKEAAAEVASVLRQAAEHSAVDHTILSIKNDEEAMRSATLCKIDFVDSLYKQLEQFVAGLEHSRHALGRVQASFEVMVTEEKRGLAGTNRRLATRPVLRNWIAIIERELRKNVEWRKEFVEPCSAERIRNKHLGQTTSWWTSTKSSMGHKQDVLDDGGHASW